MIEIDEQDNLCPSLFDKLSTEIYEEIFKYLNVKDLVNCSLVSKHWRKMVNDNKLWRHICKENGWNNVNSLSCVKSNFISNNFQLYQSDFEKDSNENLNDNNCYDNNALINCDKKSPICISHKNFDKVVENFGTKFLNHDMFCKVVKENASHVTVYNSNYVNRNNSAAEIDNDDDHFGKKFTESALNNEYRICDWKMHYLQRKFLSYNWHQGRYVRYFIGMSGTLTIPESLTLAVDHLNESWLFLPVIGKYSNYYRLHLISVDGKPYSFCQLEITTKKIEAVCVSTDIIAYIRGNELVVRRYDDLKFNFVVKDFKKTSDNYPQSQEVMEQLENDNFFIKMNSKYIIAGKTKAFIRVWCRKTLVEIDVILCPEVINVMSCIVLHSDSIYFCTRDSLCKGNFKVNEYNILSKSLEEIAHCSNHVMKLLVNDDFVVIYHVNYEKYGIASYRRVIDSKGAASPRIQFHKDYQLEYGGPEVILHNNFIFFPKRSSVLIVNLDSKSTDSLAQRKLPFYSINGLRQPSIISVHENLIILKSSDAIQVWNWKNGINLYTVCSGYKDLQFYYDCTRLVLAHKGIGQIRIISYW